MVRYFLVSVSLLFITSCASDGVDPIIHQKCGLCHSVKVALNKNRTEDDWKKVLYAMKVRGLKIDEKEEKIVLEYLIKYYGK
ncbi:MAG: hypothetical protein K6348_04845 [Deferribacterales bacterium]